VEYANSAKLNKTTDEKENKKEEKNIDETEHKL